MAVVANEVMRAPELWPARRFDAAASHRTFYLAIADENSIRWHFLISGCASMSTSDRHCQDPWLDLAPRHESPSSKSILLPMAVH
jgi:hypothetical protein